MRFDVTDIEFDLHDVYTNALTVKDETKLRDMALGIWDASDEEDMIEQITELTGWCIKSIDYNSMEDSNTLNNMKGATL